MNKAQRRLYFTQLWPAACRAQGWERNDDARRKAVTRRCMELIGGPATDSTTGLNQAQITALFAYLRHLARPDDLRLLSSWILIQEGGAMKFNQTRQGDYWRRKAGYQQRGKLERRRFENKPTAGIFDEPALSGREAEQYLMTMRARAKARGAR